MERKDKKKLERVLKPSGAYLDSLSDFADMLGKLNPNNIAAVTAAGNITDRTENANIEDIIKQAEDAAKELLDETAQPTHPTPDAVPEEEAEEKKTASLEELLEKLDELVGLENIKQKSRAS